MFKFKVGQHVWFLIGSLDDNEDPDFLHGTITRCYTEAPFYGSPDAYYEIGVDGDGFYDREERDLYESLSELQKAVTKDLRGDVQYFDKETFRLKEQLTKTRAVRRMAKKRLDNWLKRCEKEK